MFGIFPYAGLDLLIAESIKLQLENNVGWATNNDGNLHGILPFLIGGSSSMVAGSMVYPVNLIRTKVCYTNLLIIGGFLKTVNRTVYIFNRI